MQPGASWRSSRINNLRVPCKSFEAGAFTGHRTNINSPCLLEYTCATNLFLVDTLVTKRLENIFDVTSSKYNYSKSCPWNYDKKNKIQNGIYNFILNSKLIIAINRVFITQPKMQWAFVFIQISIKLPRWCYAFKFLSCLFERTTFTPTKTRLHQEHILYSRTLFCRTNKDVNHHHVIPSYIKHAEGHAVL